MIKELLAITAALLSVIGNVPYIQDVLRGKVKPHPYTWLVGSVVSCITLIGMYVKGAGYGALPVFVSECFTVTIFLLSIKHGFRDFHSSDHFFLVVALFGLVPWFVTHDPTLSVIVAVTVDVIAFVPTLRKGYVQPNTEDRLLFGTNVLRHILALLSLQTYNIATTLHSCAMIVINSGMLAVLSRRDGKQLR